MPPWKKQLINHASKNATGAASTEGSRQRPKNGQTNLPQDETETPTSSQKEPNEHSRKTEDPFRDKNTSPPSDRPTLLALPLRGQLLRIQPTDLGPEARPEPGSSDQPVSPLRKAQNRPCGALNQLSNSNTSLILTKQDKIRRSPSPINKRTQVPPGTSPPLRLDRPTSARPAVRKLIVIIVDRIEFRNKLKLGILRMLTCDHSIPPDRYNERVEGHLQQTDWGIQYQKALVNALIERWHPDTHTFHLSIGECAVTLEDMAIILGLPTEDLPVTGMTMSSFEVLEAKCLHQFGVAPKNLQLTDYISIQRYVKCHIMLLIGTILFGDNSGTGYLPLLRDFGSTGQYSWGSACLTHLYRVLCRASRYDCKEINGLLTLLLGWAWIRLSYLALLPRESRSFPLANRWHNWEHGDHRYRYLTLAHFRKALNDLQEGQFVWVAYAVDRVDPDIIPLDIYMHSVCWSATVPLVSFECIEWHATDRYRRQFGFFQGVNHQERNLDKAHGEVLTGPKNLNWATTLTHSFWVMQWTNKYSHVLTEIPVPSLLTLLGVTTPEQETDGYLGNEPDDEDEDEDEEDEIEDSDEDEESCNDSQKRTPSEAGKGYNLRIDLPRCSASRFTPSVFKKAAKKCKNLVKDIVIGYKVSNMTVYESTEHLRWHFHHLYDGIYYDYVPQPHIAYIAWDDITLTYQSHSRSASS
ncbi:hypothetical protein Ahy_A03g015341 [Arachis hypogaea]|uniref:Aminotransferase-like plant mobile domain-containing protein n=1 Tax=Arachis hypogaea TaxID=3818 RepID=A0A445E0C2_ARAHY|nr:hypothetical protein Ahy_A03g015341 [Arachis hypogaea]